MKVPLSWLREFVAIDDSVQAIADRLAMLGLAVDEIIRAGEGIENVVVGRVLEVRDHPSSNKPLVLVKADAGTGETLDIVCGARNFGAGDVVPVALVGAKLPNGMEIARRKVAGEVSNGMLCSAKELGVSEDHTGIMVLDPGLTLGEDIRIALGLDDAVFDVDVTPNRPDCLSVLGIARELAASYGVPLVDPDPEPAESGPVVEQAARVVVDDTAGCPRYVARVVTALRHGASPWWMRRRLLACGMRPVSAIVDVTNYVMLERGQPLHAFDLANVHGRTIIVRRASDGERFVTLDGVERTLSADDVMIADSDRTIGIAGVMGGGNSEISDATSDVLIESAYFDPERVLRTARRLRLRTEASVRFERGVDTDGARRAADRACALLAEVAGGAVLPGAIVAGPGAPVPEAIRLPVARADAHLGVTIEARRIADILSSLGCAVDAAGGDAFHVTPPTWRPDLRIEEDLVEEIARHHGFDNVPVTLPENGRRGGLTREQHLRRVIRRTMLGAGLSEAQTLSLISPALLDRLQLPKSHAWRNVLRLTNPLSEDESLLRPSLVPGLLAAAQRNVARRAATVALFEIGAVFAPSAGELPDEALQLAWVITGERPLGWHGRRGDTFDFFDAKGALEAVAAAIGAYDVAVTPADLGAPYHPARGGVVTLGGETVGEIGEIAPRVAESLDVNGRIAAGVVALGPLLRAAADAYARPLGRFPAVERDIAVVVEAHATSAEVAETIQGAAGPLLESIRLFDVYRGEQAGEGKVSLAFSLAFRDPERTLTDDEADAAFAQIRAAASTRGWTIRD